MSDLLSPILPALGLGFVSEVGRFFAATQNNVVRGQVLEVDTAHTSPGTTTDNVGGTTDAYARAFETQAAQGGRQVIVALENCRRGQNFMALTRGVTQLLVYGEFRAGQYVVLAAGGPSTQSKRVYGIILESGGMEGQAARAKVLWDGEVGFATLVGEEAPGGDPEFPADDIIDIFDPTPPNPGPGGEPAGGDFPGTVPAIGVAVPVGGVVEE